MGSLAHAMTDLVQHIQGASAHRRAGLDELRATTKSLLGELCTAHQDMATELRQQATALRGKLEAGEKSRLEAAQGFMRHTRGLIKHMGVRVSELRSDTHNRIQRFTLEHRDMGRALRSKLGSMSTTRVEAACQGMRWNQARRKELRAKLRAEAQSLYANLRQNNHACMHAARQTRQALAADIRQASRTWRQGPKKKPSVAYQG